MRPSTPRRSVEAYRHPDPSLRKPNPGMILQALQEWPIDRETSLLIGDKPSDLEAALRAGIRGVLFEGGDLAGVPGQGSAAAGAGLKGPWPSAPAQW